MDLSFLEDAELRRNLIVTAMLLVVLVLVRTAALRAVRNAREAPESMRLRWAAWIRSFSLAAFALCVLTVWASELQAFAVSVIAVAAALVLATKELIMCVSGALLRASSGAFSVGDRVELGGVRGDVIAATVLSTTLLEVGPGHQRTGRSVVVPNSVLLSSAAVNETFMHEYVVHVMTVPVEDIDEWAEAEADLLAVAEEVCAAHVAPARKRMDALSAQHDLPKLSVEPRVLVALSKAGQVDLVLRVPAPVRERGKVEQQILRGFLARRVAASLDESASV